MVGKVADEGVCGPIDVTSEHPFMRGNDTSTYGLFIDQVTELVTNGASEGHVVDCE